MGAGSSMKPSVNAKQCEWLGYEHVVRRNRINDTIVIGLIPTIVFGLLVLVICHLTRVPWLGVELKLVSREDI